MAVAVILVMMFSVVPGIWLVQQLRGTKGRDPDAPLENVFEWLMILGLGGVVFFVIFLALRSVTEELP